MMSSAKVLKKPRVLRQCARCRWVFRAPLLNGGEATGERDCSACPRGCAWGSYDAIWAFGSRSKARTALLRQPEWKLDRMNRYEMLIDRAIRRAQPPPKPALYRIVPLPH